MYTFCQVVGGNCGIFAAAPLWQNVAVTVKLQGFPQKSILLNLDKLEQGQVGAFVVYVPRNYFDSEGEGRVFHLGSIH